MDTKNRIGILIGVLVVFLVTLAIGIGIKTFWSKSAESESQENLPDSEPAAAKAKEKPSKGVAFTRWLITEAAEAKAEAEKDGASQEEEMEAAAAKEAEAAAEKEAEEDALEDKISLFASEGQTASGERNWKTVGADLKLTDEEKGRLQQGVMLLIQKWQAMPLEAQQAERARFQGMRTRFEAMGEEEKLEVSQRLRDRFEEWRQSGRIELPELTLD